MESLVILIPIAVIFIAVAIRIFFWAVDSGQFDDLEGPAHSILFEDEKKQDKKKQASTATRQETQTPNRFPIDTHDTK